MIPRIRVKRRIKSFYIGAAFEAAGFECWTPEYLKYINASNNKDVLHMQK